MFSWFERRLPTFPLDDPVTPPKGFFSFVWACTKGARGWLLLIALTSAALAGYEAALFAMMGRVVDWLSSATPADFGGRHFGTLVGFAAILAASALLIALHTLVKHQVLAINFPMRLRWLFHRLMLDQSLSFYANEFAGRVTTKIMQTALAVRDALFMSVDVVIGVAAYLIGILALAASFDWRLMIPRALMTGRITDAYSNITTVKLFSHTRREADHARHAMEAFKATGDAQMRLVSAFEIVNHLLSTLLLVGSTGLALYLWLHGEASAGVVAAVVAMALRLSSYSHWIMWEMTELFENVGTIQDGINTLTKVRSVRDAPDATALTVPRGEIVFDNVRFAHEEHDTPVFDGLNLTIRPGERIGLIGRSGAGKSTLVNLLLRFYDVDGGSIRIDGQDIAHVTQDSLRAAIGMVTQDTSLLHRTMRENILYGRPDATEREMREAAVRAEAADFIAQLRDRHGRSGYDVEVGERGVKLSGGQRQRVAIARVMLKDAPILVLDEATSALDSEVEVAIQRSLDGLMSGKTVIAIAHRLSTIAAMDRLIVLDAGRIVEVGTHTELLQRGGIYAALWAHQSGGFLGETADAQRETQ
ncbi:ABC transporter ATP-binding protein [Burkholderia vietnamiensis]|uniref:ABC transporter ATP-binding protein n=1 Tax=Burkholderia vietnamiensis TaxID=60552 RepID=UPI001593D2EE|nr:ABC transporter ATP-binding protein [Burkholderia vietnamiensis]WHU95882.1 ABC transporter ATP-binding protein [Burkholderia vietnamiensis]